MGHAARLGRGKAQVSLEFLVLLAAFLAFLTVWLSLILKVEGGIEKSLEFSRLEAAASDIREAADAVCLMGPGSSNAMKVSGNAKLTLSGKEMALEMGGRAVKEVLRCESSGKSIAIAGPSELVLENLEGKIKIKK